MKRRSSQLFAQAMLSILFTYLAIAGANTNGLLNPRYKLVTLLLMAFAILAWLFIRIRRHWQWQQTPLDVVMPLWAVAFGASLLANTDSWRRISIGLWYAGAYIAVWYILQDVIQNKGLRREVLRDSLLTAGAGVLLVGYVQVATWAANWLHLATGNPRIWLSLDSLRPASTLDNPNTLAAFLVILFPVALSTAISARRAIWRLILGGYTLLTLVLLLFTFSRGGWVSAAGAVSLLAILLLAHHHLLSIKRLRVWWQGQSSLVRAMTGGAVLVTLVAAVVFVVVLIRLSNAPGRSIDLRTSLYDTAIKMFAEKPLTGFGLFTYGRGLMRIPPDAPQQFHAHAHNVFLNIAAELGILGLAALAVTLVALGLAMRRNWRHLKDTERLMLAGYAASLIGLGIDHLTDFTIISPAIALSGLVVLALAVAPIEPIRVPIWRQRLQPVLLTGMAVVMALGAAWSMNAYNVYLDATLHGVAQDDPLGAAQQLQQAIALDPEMPIYTLNRAYFLGIAARNGDRAVVQQAIDAFVQFSTQEPYYYPAWANLAALYWQLGSRDQAIEAMQRATELAPYSWSLVFDLGTYQESAGNADAARQSYAQALKLYADANLYAEWTQTALRREFQGLEPEATSPAKVATLLRDNKVTEAQTAWSQALPTEENAYSGTVIKAILALAQNDRAAADEQMRKAEALAGTPDNLWLHLGRAYLAHFDGDAAALKTELGTIKTLLAPSPYDSVDNGTSAIAYSQFLRLGLSRYLLPQVYDPQVEPAYLVMLDHLETQQ